MIPLRICQYVRVSKSWANARKCKKSESRIHQSIKSPSTLQSAWSDNWFWQVFRFQRRLCMSLKRQLSVPTGSLFNSCLYLRLSNSNYQSSSLSPAISKSFLEIVSACGVDHRSQQSRRSRQLKTNMVRWYHLICWTPLSSKISLYSPPSSACTRLPNQTYSLPLHPLR